MTDIVERLRASNSAGMMCDEAAGEIEWLRQEHERLRAALTRLVAWEGAVELACPELGGLLKAMYDTRSALEGKDG